MIVITTTCPFCGKLTEIEVDEKTFARYQAGEVLIQDAFPELNASERELLITGMCFDCQDRVFNDEDEWEDDPDDDDWDNDIGFDPYLGCYTGDC